jgi:hypothetical protein
MFRKIFGLLLVAALFFSVSSVSSAMVRGLDASSQELVKVGEDAVVPADAVVKSAVSIGGSVTVIGQVKEDVVAVGGPVYLKKNAEVGGDVVSVGAKVVKEPGAVIKAIISLLTFIGFIILTILVVALFTPQLGLVSANIEQKTLRSFLLGLLIAILFVPIVIALAVSIIGIILIPVWGVLVAVAAFFGYFAVGHLIGKKTLHAFKVQGKSMMIETLIGIIILSLISLVPIGGHIIKLIAVLCGLGGVYETRFGTRA